MRFPSQQGIDTPNLHLKRYICAIGSLDDHKSKQHRATLLILVATCERSLEAFQAADNQIDEDFVADLERIIARTRRELVAFDAKAAEAT